LLLIGLFSFLVVGSWLLVVRVSDRVFANN